MARTSLRQTRSKESCTPEVVLKQRVDFMSQWDNTLSVMCCAPFRNGCTTPDSGPESKARVGKRLRRMKP